MWWVEEPNAIRRPYLVLARQTGIPALNTVIALPATRTVREIPTELVLDEDDGMPQACALSFDNVANIPKVFFRERITRLSVERMTEACRALAVATVCA